MSYTFKSEFFGGPEWAVNPDNVSVTISDALHERIPAISAMLKEHGLSFACIWYAGSYEFFVNEDEDGNEVEGGRVFDPEYRVEGCHIHIYADGGLSFQFPLKHCSEEGWSGGLKLSDAVREVTP